MMPEIKILIPLDPEDRQSTEIFEAYNVQFILKNPEMFRDVFDHLEVRV